LAETGTDEDAAGKFGPTAERTEQEKTAGFRYKYLGNGRAQRQRFWRLGKVKILKVKVPCEN